MAQTTKTCNCRAGHVCNQPVYENYDKCKGCLRDFIQAYYPTSYRAVWANVFHTPLTCDKSKEPPCHLEPSTELCKKCSLNTKENTTP
jgi:hypothetical protein